MSEVDSSHTTDDVQFAIDPDNTLPMDDGDSSHDIEIVDGKTSEESVENGNSSNGEEKEANETTRAINLATSPPPPPVVNPWNKNTKNARNSTEKGRVRFHEFARQVLQRLILFYVV